MRKRIFPEKFVWWAPFWYVGRKMSALVAGLAADTSIASGATVVDYGCGDQPYRRFFPRCEYIGADLPGNPKASVDIAPSGECRLAAGCADIVLSTQVLEHVEDPTTYLSECCRLLRPGGTLLLSTHGVMYFHPHPTDLWRWTHDGLRVAVERAGFEVLEQRGVMTLAAASLQLIQHYLLQKAPRILHRPLCAVLQASIAIVDQLGNEDDRRINGFVLAVRATKSADSSVAIAG